MPEALALRPLPDGAHARVVAIVRPSSLDAVMEALHAQGLRDVLIEAVRGYNRQKTHLADYEELGHEGGFLPKVRLQFVVEGARLVACAQALCDAARTGRIGDGKLFVHRVQVAS